MTHVITQSYRAGDTLLIQETSVTDAEEVNVDVTLSPGDTDIAVDPVILTNSKVLSLVLYCSGDCTIKTNSTGAPGNTVNLTAGQTVIWSSAASIGTNPFVSADVTKLYLSSTAGGNFKLRSIINAA